MGDVPGGHGQHRQHGHRSGPAADPPAALVERGQVAVQVAGVGAPAGHLAARGGHLAHRLGVAGHVGQHDQHVPAELEGQVLGDGERDPRGEDPLDHRVVGGVEQQHQLPGRGALLQRRRAPRPRRRGSGPCAAKTTLNGSSPAVGLRGDLGGQLAGAAARRRRRSAASAPHQRGQRVDRRDAGEHRLGRRLAVRRVQRAAGHRGDAGRPGPAGRRRAARRGRCRPGPASPARPGRAAAAPAKATRVRARHQPVGALEHLHHGQVAVDLEHQAVPRPAVRPAPRITANSSQPTPATPRTTSSGPRSSAHPGRTRRAARRRGRPALLIAAPAGSPAPAPRRAADPGGVVRAAVSCAARSSGAKSSSSISAAVTPRRPVASHRSTTASTASSSAAAFAARAVRVVGRQRALLQHPLAQQPAGEQHHPLVPGQRAGPDQLGQVAQPVGLGEQAGHPGPPRGPVRVAVAGVPGAESGRRRGRTSRPSRPPGSAGRRRGRGPGSTALRTNRWVCAVTGSVRSPPGGETAPMIVTDAVRAAEGAHPPGPLVERGERRGQARPGSPPRPAARRSARRTRAAPRPSGRWSRR